MPAIGNLSVVEHSGGGSVTYTALQASGGDNSPAIWRDNALDTAAAFRPELRIISRPNGPKTARRVDFQYTYPYTVTDSAGAKTVKSRINFQGSMVVPLDFPDATIDKAVWQVTALLASTGPRNAFYSGFAPT